MTRNARGRFRFRNVATTALMLCSGPLLASGDYLLEHHEVVDDIDVLESRTDAPGTRTLTLSTNVSGRDLIMELHSNEDLTASMTADDGKAKAKASASGSEFELLRGTLQGVDGSWVRLTRSGGKFTGVVYDGERLLAMEPFETVRDMIPNAEASASAGDHVMYDTDDMIAMNGQSCGVEGHDVGGEGLVEELQQLPARAVGGQLNVAFLADGQFARANGDVEEAVLTRLNIVDGIFSEQVGIRINPSEIRQVGGGAGLSASNAGQLLGQLSRYSTSQLSNPGLVHLFTGRDLDGGTVGIAYLNAICSERSGHSLTQSTSSSPVTASLIAAHELGHNFGAPHDNQRGSACASASGNFLMNPGINGSDTFSQCSLNRIEPVVARASCIVPVADPQPPEPAPEPEPTPEPAPEPRPDPLVLAFDFNDRSSQGFRFRADPWGLGNAPAYQSAVVVTNGGASGGALVIRLGGRDDRDVTNMSAGARRTFELEAASDLRISFKADLRQSPRYERDERSEIRASFDGKFLRRSDNGGPRLAKIRGNGNGGDVRATGFKTYRFDLESVPAGRHELIIGGFNNKKTESPESTVILVDDVRIESRGSVQAANGGSERDPQGLGSRLVGLR